MKVAIKRAGSLLELMETTQQYRTDAVCELLGKDITPQPIWLDADRTLAFICDENGSWKHKPINFFLEVPNPFSPVQAITGDVVFMRTKLCDPSVEEIWDYEVADIQDADIQLIQYLLNDEKQVSLTMDYFLQGG